MLHAPLSLSLFARERGFYCFPGFCFSRGKHSIAWKEIITSHASGRFKLAILKYVLTCCLINEVADANGLRRAIRPTEFFNIKKIAADFCSAQCTILGLQVSNLQKFASPFGQGTIIAKILLITTCPLLQIFTCFREHFENELC